MIFCPLRNWVRLFFFFFFNCAETFVLSGNKIMRKCRAWYDMEPWSTKLRSYGVMPQQERKIGTKIYAGLLIAHGKHFI